jgi:hypothetical protein
MSENGATSKVNIGLNLGTPLAALGRENHPFLSEPRLFLPMSEREVVNACRALVPTAPDNSRASRGDGRVPAAFVAQLLACKAGINGYRARRRADTDAGAAAYAVTGGGSAPHALRSRTVARL